LTKKWVLTAFLQISILEIGYLEGKEGEGMPSYDYRCPKCNKKFTAILSMKEHDAGRAKCPKCGGKKLEQLITAFQVKTSRKS
jgi:putative FmdB family regulatory protein